MRSLMPDGTIYGDAGGAAGSSIPGAGYLTELGITASGCPFQINDALINAPGGYHALSLCANSAGGALLSYNAFGGATGLPLQFNINGANYQFPITLSGILGPNPSTVGHPAIWNNGVGTLLAMPDQMQMTPAITVAGSTVTPANSALWINATRSGTSTNTFTVPLVYIKDTESITDVQPVNNSIATLYVEKSFGTGEGVRTGILSFLSNTAPTAGGPTQSTNNFYTAVFGATAITNTDGGTNISPRGDFFGMGGYAIAYSGSTWLDDVVGAEFDTSLQAGSSAANRSSLQVAIINTNAINATVTDTLISLVGDSSITTGVMCGICYGRNFTKWPISSTGTLIGTYATTNTMTAKNGVDLSGAIFTGTGSTAFKAPGFWVAGASAGGGENAGDVVLSHNLPALIWNDAASAPTGGGLTRFAGFGSGAFGYQINTSGAADFSTAINAFNINSAGAFMVGSNANPTVGFQSSVTGVTAGGLTKFILSSGQLSYEINTAVAGDFSTLITPLFITASGAVSILPPVSANGSVATVLGSLGPAGSHTTVQEWLQILGSGGVTRYVPGF